MAIIRRLCSTLKTREMNSALNGLYIAVLHHEDIRCRSSREVSKLELYSDLYNWEGLEFPVAVRPYRQV